MHRFAFRLLVALLTFIIGVAAASVWLLRCGGSPNRKQTTSDSSQVNEFALEASKLNNVFRDFTFVESIAYMSDPLPAHERETKTFPAKYDVGWQYVFRNRDSNNDTLFEELQNRIRSEGFDILAADRIGHRYVGGLLFRITFRKVNHKFTLSNTGDREIQGRVGLHKSWLGDDYILLVEESTD